MDDEETGSVPSPVKLLPRNRYRSREVVGPASQPDADPPLGSSPSASGKEIS